MMENTHDLQTHVKHWCPRSSKRTLDSSDDEEPQKKVKYDRVSSRDSDASIDGDGEDEEDVVFAKFAKVAKDNNEKEWQERKVKYMKSGLSESNAESKADSKLQEDDMTEFMKEYGALILNNLRLRNGRLHTEIIETIDSYIGDGIDRKRAIRTVLKKHRSEFEEYLMADGESEEDGEDGSDTEEDDSDTAEDGDAESTVDDERDENW